MELVQKAPIIHCKEGVDFNTLNSLLKIAVYITKTIYEKYGAKFVLTSTSEGTHIINSLHYSNNAYDCRTRTLTLNQIDSIYGDLDNILTKLDRDFEIIWENDHLHIELDRSKPNGKTNQNEKQQTLL